MKSHHKHLFTIILLIAGIALAAVLFYENSLYRVTLPVVTDYATSNENLPVRATITTAKGFQIYARVADTAATQQLGLSYISSLPDSQGMLFTFDKPGVQKFWMKGMAFPLDMIWMNHISGDTYKVVDIAANVPSSSYPQTFGPETNTDTVLEINANDAVKFGIKTEGSLTIDISK